MGGTAPLTWQMKECRILYLSWESEEKREGKKKKKKQSTLIGQNREEIERGRRRESSSPCQPQTGKECPGKKARSAPNPLSVMVGNEQGRNADPPYYSTLVTAKEK